MAKAKSAISLGVSALIVTVMILIVGFGVYLNGAFNTGTTTNTSRLVGTTYLSLTTTSTTAKSTFSSQQTIYSSKSSSIFSTLAIGSPSDCNLSATEVLSSYGSIPATIQSTLNPLYACQSESNPDYYIHPVIQMNPNSVGEIRVIYLITNPGIPTNNSYPQVYAMPYLSKPNAALISDAIPFNLSSLFQITNATLVWKNNSTTEYQYTIASLPDSTGYYDLTLPSSCGQLQTPLAVGIKSASLSANYLDEFGYNQSGVICAGPTAPGIIVGVENMSVTYVMIQEFGSND